MDIKREVIVTFTQEGWHRWPEAPAVVGYLASLHRHLFHVVVRVKVSKNDREVEFHQLLERARHLFAISEDWSCEDMAENLLVGLTNNFSGEYSGREVRVEVWEDGENGASISLNPS